MVPYAPHEHGYWLRHVEYDFVTVGFSDRPTCPWWRIIFRLLPSSPLHRVAHLSSEIKHLIFRQLVPNNKLVLSPILADGKCHFHSGNVQCVFIKIGTDRSANATSFKQAGGPSVNQSRVGHVLSVHQFSRGSLWTIHQSSTRTYLQSTNPVPEPICSPPIQHETLSAVHQSSTRTYLQSTNSVREPICRLSIQYQNLSIVHQSSTRTYLQSTNPILEPICSPPIQYQNLFAVYQASTGSWHQSTNQVRATCGQLNNPVPGNTLALAARLYFNHNLLAC